MTHPLDKVSWTALTTRQAHLSEGDERARRFQSDIGPFAAAVDVPDEAIASLAGPEHTPSPTIAAPGAPLCVGRDD